MAVLQAAIAVARPVTTYRAIDLGAGALAVGLLTGAFALLPMLVALRRFGRSVLVAMSTVGAGAAVALLPLTGHVVVLGVLLALIGFLLGVGQPLMMTVIVRAVPEDARGAALALRLVGNRVGLVGTPAAAGVLAGAAGVSAAFWLLGALLGIALVGSRQET
jgi:MFS family permease